VTAAPAAWAGAPAREDYRLPRKRPKRLPGWSAPEVVPNHVKQCSKGRGKGSRLWWIYTWRHSAPEARIRIPYSCNSWRCEACAPHEAAVLWRRITDATKPYDPLGWVFLVLTVDQRGFFDKRTDGWRKYHDVKECYRDLGSMTQKLLKRIRYHQKCHGQQQLGNEWFAVVEAHRSGWPHLNLCIYAPQLARDLDFERRRVLAYGGTARQSTLVSGDLLRMVVKSGWGVQSSAERARDREALAGYVTKLAGFSDAAAGEVAKVTQVPTAAPPKFRRVRSGRGFLPPRQASNEGWTGALIRRQVCNDGMPVVLPLHNVKPEHALNVVHACELEDQIWERERETLYRKRATVARYGPEAVLGPPVQYWDGGRLRPPEDPAALPP